MSKRGAEQTLNSDSTKRVKPSDLAPQYLSSSSDSSYSSISSSTSSSSSSSSSTSSSPSSAHSSSASAQYPTQAENLSGEDQKDEMDDGGSKSPGSASDTSADTVFERDIEAEISKTIVVGLGQGTILGKIIARTKTKNQGDHITSVAVLNEIIYNFLEGKAHKDIITQLPNLLDILGLDKGGGGVKSTITSALEEQQKFSQNNKLNLDEKHRKDLRNCAEITYPINRRLASIF